MRCFATGVKVGFIVWVCGSACSRASTPSNPITPEITGVHTLSGVVRRADNHQPIPYAEVEVRSPFVTVYRTPAMTDLNGSFTISNVRGGRILVDATRQGYEASSVSVTLSGDTRVDIRMAERVDNVLVGTVYESTTDGRVPLEGALVEDWGSHVDTVTDRNGAYRLPGLDGPVYLAVSKPGYERYEARFAPSRDMRVDVELRRLQ
jgi:hypothetical protein